LAAALRERWLTLSTGDENFQLARIAARQLKELATHSGLKRLRLFMVTRDVRSRGGQMLLDRFVAG